MTTPPLCTTCQRPLDPMALLHGDGETCTACLAASRRKEGKG